MFFSWRARETRQAAHRRPALRLRCRPRLEILEDRCVFSATGNPVVAQTVPVSVLTLASQVTTQPVLNQAGQPTGVTAALTGGGNAPLALNVVQNAVSTVPSTSLQSFSSNFSGSFLVSSTTPELYGVGSSTPAVTGSSSGSSSGSLKAVGGVAQGAPSQPAGYAFTTAAQGDVTWVPATADGSVQEQVVLDDAVTQQSTPARTELGPPPVTVTESPAPASLAGNTVSLAPAVQATNPLVIPSMLPGNATIRTPPIDLHSQGFAITIPQVPGQGGAAPGGGTAQTRPGAPAVQFVTWAGQAAVAGYDIVVQAVTIFVLPTPGQVFSWTVSGTFIVPETPSLPSAAANPTPPGNEGSSLSSPAPAQVGGSTGGPVRLLQLPVFAPSAPVLAFAVTLSASGRESSALSLSGLRPPPVTVTEQSPWASLREHGGHRPSTGSLPDPLTETAPATAAGPPPPSSDESFAIAEAAPVEIAAAEDSETYLHPLYQVAERGELSGPRQLSGTGLVQAALERSVITTPNRWTQETDRLPEPDPVSQQATSSRKEAAHTFRRLGRALVPIAATWAVLQAMHTGILKAPAQRQPRS